MRSINDYRCLDCSSLCNRCPHLSLNLEIRNPRLLLFKKCGIPTSTGDKNKCPLRPYLIYTNDLVRKRKFLKFTFFIFYVKGVFSKSNLDKKFCGWTFTDEELSRASSTLTSLSPGGHYPGPLWCGVRTRPQDGPLCPELRVSELAPPEARGETDHRHRHRKQTVHPRPVDGTQHAHSNIEQNWQDTKAFYSHKLNVHLKCASAKIQ